MKSLIQPHVRAPESARAHDLRAHATSKAWFARVPVNEVIRAAAWKTPSSFVAHYLTDTVSAEGSFAKSVLTRRPGLFQQRPDSSRRGQPDVRRSETHA
ncbi:hypothetical protein HOLleu_12954 [Holothuria leucospilota]|uniref:Uncharacterized protein n=1 Tax=Holothuria leucospilota TaxID=206669 RepID=A0A9Q1HAH8_HOLLE|nr:hypothetical protein HOLleu_12954 [Holothuria leucospilota]